MTSHKQQIERIDVLKHLNHTSEAHLTRGHRGIVLVSGPTTKVWELICDYLLSGQSTLPTPVTTPFESLLDTTLSSVTSLPLNILINRADKPSTLLGFDCNNAVMDCSQGFYPDALTAIAGTIRPGGFLFIISPAIDQWPTSPDDFASNRTSHGYELPACSPNTIKRFIEHCTKHDATCLHLHEDALFIQSTITQASSKQTINHWAPKLEPTPLSKSEKLTPDQSSTLSAIISSLDLTATKLSPAELAQQISGSNFHIIQADRGRGKSHLLGHLINAFVSSNENANEDNGINYYITAPNKASIQSVNRSLTSLMNDNQNHHNSNTDQTLHFVAPEDVLTNVTQTDLLIVDEAASLPLPQLMLWAKHVNTIIFATTTHGYEGTGKGFQIRFIDFLKNLTDNIHQHKLTQAIRYADNDPLEQSLFQSFALNSEPKGLTAQFEQSNIKGALSRRITQQELTSNPALLDELFSLLVQAHYQTRPSDIRDLLDGTGISVYGSFIINNSEEYLVSACLISLEGNFNNQPPANADQIDDNLKLINNIQKGIRRPKGHLIPQVLTLHMNQLSALLHSGARVVRIATLANLQNKDIASNLLSVITQDLANQNVDYIGSSYASTNDVNRFWSKNGFTAVRKGNKQDKASGTHSALVIKGLSSKGKTLEKQAREYFDCQKIIHENYQTLTKNERALIDTFLSFTGSYEAIKDILSRCKNWPEFYGLRPFPKKAKKDFKELVQHWTQLP